MAKKRKQKQPKKQQQQQQAFDPNKMIDLAIEGLRVISKYNDPRGRFFLDQRYKPMLEAIRDTAVSPRGQATDWGIAALAKYMVLAAYVLGQKRQPPNKPLAEIPYHLLAQIEDLNDDDNAELTPLAASHYATLFSTKMTDKHKQESSFDHVLTAYKIGAKRRMSTYEQRTSNS